MIFQNKAYLEDFLKYGECPGYGRSAESMLASMKKTVQYKILADGVPVGKVSAHEITEGQFHLDNLCIIPEYENRGIGQMSVKFIEGQFPNVIRWSLETPKDKLRNHYFYRKCGFEITDEVRDGNVIVVIFSKNIKNQRY